MQTFVLRLWLPDRPGALGQVASRIGAVRGGIVGIEILERDGGLAVDEVVVELPDEALLDLLVQEVEQVDGARVEALHPLVDVVHDPRLDALEAATELLAAADPDDLLTALGARAERLLSAERSSIVPIDSVPSVPDPHLAWAALSSEPSALVVFRSGRPFRSRERRQLEAVAQIADHRLRELAHGTAALPRD